MNSLKSILEKKDKESVYVIAEVGSNFGADLELAGRYIQACASAGADAVKFQSWTTEKILNRTDPETGGLHPAYPILEKYELPAAWHAELNSICEANQVDFLSTPFDIDKARLLRNLGVSAIKIASGDLTYVQLLKEVGQYGVPILLSTGMARLEEIEQALEELGEDARGRVILLHCVAAYPPDIADANIRAVDTLARHFGLPVGISDHYPGDVTVLGAVALGARVVEKHVTFSRQGETPDSPFALEMDEFQEMVERIRVLEVALGDGIKRCRPSEEGGLTGGRRSLYWSVDLEAGTKIQPSHVAVVRPNAGDFQPVEMDTLIGKVIVRSVNANSPILRQDVDAP